MIHRRNYLKRTPLRRVSKKRSSEKREYAERKAEYLAAHPWDQIIIALHCFDEEWIIEQGCDHPYGRFFLYRGIAIQRSDQIHHRAKCFGARLLDERWWMATSLTSHQWLEDHKTTARAIGLLLPIQADADGKWGDGNQALPTPELMKERAAR